jgi:DNA-binding transcriptional ArsR family regulator
MTAILPAGVEQQLRSAEPLSPELTRLMRKARDASDFLKALANESRLLLLCLIAESERSVTELEEILSLRQPNVSQQLARLRLDGLVDTRRDGKTIYYRLASEDVRQLITVIYGIFCAGGGPTPR